MERENGHICDAFGPSRSQTNSNPNQLSPKPVDPILTRAQYEKSRQKFLDFARLKYLYLEIPQNSVNYGKSDLRDIISSTHVLRKKQVEFTVVSPSVK